MNEVDNRVINHETTKAEQATVLNMVSEWSMDETTGLITVTKLNGEKILFDLNVEKIPISFKLSEDGILSMTTDDGTVFTANIGSMIPVLTFESTDTIAVSVSGEGINKTYSFTVKDGSITGDKLQPNYLADITAQAQAADLSAQSASVSAASAEVNAKRAEDMAGLVDVQIGSATSAGIVKPDGTTITVAEDGTISVNKGTGTTTSKYSFGSGSTSLKNVIADENTFVNTETLSDIIDSNNKAIANRVTSTHSYAIDAYNRSRTIQLSLGAFGREGGNYLDGVLVADGDELALNEAAMYIMLVNSWLNTTGAFRGSQAYAIATNTSAGSTTTAQAIPKIYQLGSTGTPGVRLEARARDESESGVYSPYLGVGSCTTACYVSYSLYRID